MLLLGSTGECACVNMVQVELSHGRPRSIPAHLRQGRGTRPLVAPQRNELRQDGTRRQTEAVVARYPDRDPRSDDDRRGGRGRAEVALGDGRAVGRGNDEDTCRR